VSEPGQDPQQVTALLLSDARMVDACAAHDVRTVIRLLRDRGVSLNRLSNATGISAGRMHDYWTGARQLSAFELFECISDGLRIPGRYLRLADRPWERSQTSA
jgi:hypothetical protein